MTPFFAPPPNPHGPPRIFLSAAGPRMAELAGETADGLIAPPFASRRHLTEILLPAAQRGLAKAGRSRDAFTVLCCPLVATGYERTAAVEEIRRQVGMYLSSRTYRRVLDLHGLGRLGDDLAILTSTDDPAKWQRASELINDDILDLFAVTGPPQAIGEELRHRFGELTDRVCVPSPYGPDAALWIDTARGIHQPNPSALEPSAP